MTSAIYVSLGHNSSATYAVNGKVVRGYELERINRVKASSEYPREAIELAMQDHDGPVRTAYVSHWFDDFEMKDNKYVDWRHLQAVAERVVTVTPDWTHHDSHANSAFSFYRSHERARDDAMYIVVMDGFGNLQECFSFYEAHPNAGVLKVKHRSYGYDMSLGLMYQYATSSIGLKENQDEYKLLGYEAHILEHYDRSAVERAKAAIVREAHVHAHRMLQSNKMPVASGNLIDYQALQNAKRRWQTKILSWLDWFPPANNEAMKIATAFSAQTFIEAATEFLLNELLPRNLQRTLVLTGGCFYNVKLNRSIQNRKERPLVFAHPLAGDQGAAMGDPTLEHPRGLLIGDRVVPSLLEDVDVPGLVMTEGDEWIDVTESFLKSGCVVNLFRGAMEYGPRALCNTSTLALPTRDNVALINRINERDEAMPMAPVMTPYAASRLFWPHELLGLSESERYMITTVAFRGEPPRELKGVAHCDPLKDVWTARPQVTDDPGMLKLLRRFEYETLINTSFNFHGEPIVHTLDDAIRTQQLQNQRARSGKNVLVVVMR